MALATLGDFQHQWDLLPCCKSVICLSRLHHCILHAYPYVPRTHFCYFPVHTLCIFQPLSAHSPCGCNRILQCMSAISVCHAAVQGSACPGEVLHPQELQPLSGKLPCLNTRMQPPASHQQIGRCRSNSKCWYWAHAPPFRACQQTLLSATHSERKPCPVKYA